MTKAIHPARTTLQAINSSIPACSYMFVPLIFATSRAFCPTVWPIVVDSMAHKHSGSFLPQCFAFPYLIVQHGQKEVPAARQRLDEPQILEQVSVFGSSRVDLFPKFCFILVLDAFQIGWPCESNLKREDFLFYKWSSTQFSASNVGFEKERQIGHNALILAFILRENRKQNMVMVFTPKCYQEAGLYHWAVSGWVPITQNGT